MKPVSNGFGRCHSALAHHLLDKSQSARFLNRPHLNQGTNLIQGFTYLLHLPGAGDCRRPPEQHGPSIHKISRTSLVTRRPAPFDGEFCDRLPPRQGRRRCSQQQPALLCSGLSPGCFTVAGERSY